MTPVILRNLVELRKTVGEWKAAGDIVGVVPTMGALHEGHLSLARAARQDCSRVIVTIFVNPKQFNNPDDLKKYPRTEETDALALGPVGVDVIFAPMPDEVYPEGFATRVSLSGIAASMEGDYRPGHFDGVATVVTKLFGMTQADRAYFGQKDWQQLQVVRRLVADLDIPIEIIGCETVREADGLAMSSRNQRLAPEARKRAAALYRVLKETALAIRNGAPVPAAMKQAQAEIVTAGFDSVDYIELRNATTLERVQDLTEPARILAAAMIGGVRLIDNIAV